MKIFYFILLFSAFVFRPVAKIGVLSYYGLNVDYIVENYCVNKTKPQLKCNGKCYLKDKLQFNNFSKNNKEKKSIAEVFVPVFFEAYTYKKNQNLFYTKHTITSFYYKGFSYQRDKNVDPPPQFIS